MEKQISEVMLYNLADLFKTFGDTTRIRILYALMDHDMCVQDLAVEIGATQSAVSHQLRILKQADLVKFHKQGKNAVYSLADNHVHSIIKQGTDHLAE